VREREIEWMATFVWHQAQKFGSKSLNGNSLGILEV
jgi:hypothetical protein